MQQQSIHIPIPPLPKKPLNLPPRPLNHMLTTLTPQTRKRVNLKRQENLLALEAAFAQHGRGAGIVGVEVAGVEVAVACGEGLADFEGAVCGERVGVVWGPFH